MVQVVGDVVTHAAFRELGHHGSRMRNTVAILTLGNHFVFCLVAGHAENRFMLGGAVGEQVVGFLVTRCAQFGLGFTAIGNHERHVGLVTLLAVGLTHIL